MKKAITKSRATPQIGVLLPNPPGYFSGPRWALARLRNKKGYIYLQWKDGETVRSLYIGKAPRSSTTDRAPGQLAGDVCRIPRGRVRKRPAVGQKSSRIRRGTKAR